MERRMIKFRARHIVTGEWLYGSYHDEGGGEYILPIHALGLENFDKYEVDGSTLGQCTGFMDSRERYIYEGDIVRIDGLPEKGNLVVVFYDGSFALATPKEYSMLEKNEHPFLNDYARLPEFGVLDYQGLYRKYGNVFDNPELLKGDWR